MVASEYHLKHLGSSYICEFSLYTKFQLPGLCGSNVSGVGGWVGGWPGGWPGGMGVII